jgi:hypothetical protein
VALTPTALSAGNAAFGAGNADLYFAWSTTDATILNVDAAGNITAAAPGLATITAEAFRLADSLSTGAEGSLSLAVAPGPLTGTPSTTTGPAGTAATITAAAGDPPFDANTIGTLDLLDVVGIAPAPAPMSATQFSFMLPMSTTVGDHSLVISGLGPDNLAQEMIFTVTAGPPADPWETDDPFTAPALRGPGRYFGSLSPTDVDDFFTVDNSAGATAMHVDVTVTWPGGDDIDILWVDEFFTAYVGNFSGATGANPEHSAVDVPAGTVWRLWINFYAGGNTDLYTIDVTN